MPRIHNWSTTVRGIGPYSPPELGGLALMGRITGHSNPDVGKGPVSITSIIVGKRNGKVVTESGTEYALGLIDPVYEDEFPGAHRKLLDQLEEV